MNNSAEILPPAEDPRVGASLNPAQLSAVMHGEGPLLVLAGAGSGKTRVLTHRIAHLVATGKARPDNILAVTFTNKAANEMKHRLQSLLGERADHLWVSTFHSACLRILRRHAKLIDFRNDFVVYDDQDSTSVMKKLLKAEGITDKRLTPSFFLSHIDRWKNEFIDPSKAAAIKGSLNLALAAEIYDKYQRMLFQSQAMDFGDLLFKALQLFLSHPEILEVYQYHLHYILVDEFQDTNKVQYQLLKLLAEPRRNILVVGDDDQSIYSFRGAKVSTIINFDKDFPGTRVVVLDQNYRSTSTILRAANAVIAKNTERRPKNLWTDSEEGDSIALFVSEDETEEADYVARSIQDLTTARSDIPYSSIAVFYRTNAQSRALEDALLSLGIPYRIFGGLKFYDRKEIKDILAYLRILVNPDDMQSVLRVINTPPRGIGGTTVAQLESLAAGHGINLIECARSVSPQVKSLSRFIELYDHLVQCAQSYPLSSLIKEIVDASGYRERLTSIGGDEAQSRIENLDELQGVASQMDLAGETPWETISVFLDRASLSSSADLPQEDNSRPTGAVSLTTLHLAKGLEFPIVFLTGLEEGLIPHYRSLEDPTAVEEERRLCYVGITRAMKKLHLTRSLRREMFSAGGGFGATGVFRMPSRFLKDLPFDAIEAVTEESVPDSPRYIPIEQEDPGFRTGGLGRGSMKAVSGFHQPNQLQRKTPPSIASRSSTVEGLVKSADAIEPQGSGGALLSSDEIAIGKRVFHPTFGDGTVTHIEGDIANKPDSARITIIFDKNAVSKRLLLKYARLRACAESQP